MATALAVKEAHILVQDERDLTIPTGRKESYSDCSFGRPGLSNKQADELCRTLADFQDEMSDLPGKTDILEHDVKLTDG